MDDESKKYRKYDSNSLRMAYDIVKTEGRSIYFAAKQCNIPWSTLKRYVEAENDKMQKMGRPFALPSNLELKLFNYIIEMQELGFGFTVFQVRKTAYDLAKSLGREKMLASPKEIASKWWWANFKKRYGLCLRVPENLSAYRASMANEEMVKDFFTKLEDLVTKLGIKDKPNLLWNCDETGMSYVVKPSRVVTAIGKKYVYRRTYAEHGQTQTLLACICANGTWIPPMIIFKGVRWNDILKRDALPNSLVRLSPKGWINSELFLEWLNFFITSIPPERPVILLMDSHSAHVGPDVLETAKSNQVYLMTFPAHCTHILQPLDVGVFKSLKSHWRQSMANYMRNNPSSPPNRSNFHSILNPAFVSALSANNIVNAFKKTGICPLDGNAVPVDALRPSALTDQPVMIPQQADSSVISSAPLSDLNTTAQVSDILVTPKVAKKKASNNKLPKRDSSAKCLTPLENQNKRANKTPVENLSSPGTSKQTTKERHLTQNDDDWECGVCERMYSEDARKKNGAEWIQCSYCLTPYHENCLGIMDLESSEKLYYRCDNCM